MVITIPCIDTLNITIGDRIGKGATSAVYQVHMDSIPYAMKVLDTHLISFCMWEITMYTLLKHPHIMKIKHMVRIDHRYIGILMDQAPSTLHRSYKERLEPHTSREVVWALLCALDYMHTNGIIHRDLKMDNILMFEGDIPMIIDFGASRIIHEHTRVSSQVQTYTYRAPEVFARKRYDHKIDIWSLGIIAMSLLLGYNPVYHYEEYQVKFDSTWINKMITLAINTLDSDKEEWEQVLRGMLSIDPSTRLNAKDILMMNLFSHHEYEEPKRITLRSEPPIVQHPETLLTIRNIEDYENLYIFSRYRRDTLITTLEDLDLSIY